MGRGKDTQCSALVSVSPEASHGSRRGTIVLDLNFPFADGKTVAQRGSRVISRAHGQLVLKWKLEPGPLGLALRLCSFYSSTLV